MRYLQQLKYIDAVARVGSIRRAAERLAITSTALNRRILAVEEDLGTPIFERHSTGVRLSTAGELFIQHVRQQLSDMERVRSQIADLSGERRGHVSVICGPALMLDFIPTMVSRYREQYPGVSFSVVFVSRQQAAEKLIDYSADISVVFEPEESTSVQILGEVSQQLYLLAAEGHPLAEKTEVRLSDCAQFPMALPSHRAGIRYKLDSAAARRNMSLPVVVESDSADLLIRCLKKENMIAFQIPIALDEVTRPGTGLVAIPLSINDIPAGRLQVSQQRGRILPVAAARFADFVTAGLQEIPVLD